jgi:tetraacyldisaccharide 4'-kinase
MRPAPREIHVTHAELTKIASTAARPAVAEAPGTADEHAKVEHRELQLGRRELRLARRGGAIELLRLPALVFGAAARARRGLYDRRWLPIARLAVPVISVGNLSTGGTGKTPMCAWLVRELASRGLRPGILSRGYRASASGRNDEALLLERECPGVPHVQDPDRVRGGRELASRGVDVVVLDDGFQHRRLSRDVDLVLLDATRPWGLPRVDAASPPVCALLPRGLLREPPSSLARADAIVITRADQVAAREIAELEREIQRVAVGVPIARAGHRACRLRDERGRESPLESISGREVDLVSAIGNPEAFEAGVRATGAIVRKHRAFPDHHAYRREDVDALGASTGAATRPLVTTAKDAVKLAPLGVEFHALEIEIELTSARPVIEALLDSLPHPSSGGSAHV